MQVWHFLALDKKLNFFCMNFFFWVSYGELTRFMRGLAMSSLEFYRWEKHPTNDICVCVWKKLRPIPRWLTVVVEKLLQLFVGEVDANLFEAVAVEDLETGNVQHTDEELAFLPGLQSLVDTDDQPQE